MNWGLILFCAAIIFMGHSPGMDAAPAAKRTKSSSRHAAKNSADAGTPIFADGFDTPGQLVGWTTTRRVSPDNVANGSIFMVSDNKGANADGGDPTTSLTYSIGDSQRDIAVEIKFDEFEAEGGCYLQIFFMNGAGDALMYGVWSGNPNSLHFQVVGDRKSQCMEQTPWPTNAGVIKAQFTAKTGTLQGFYRDLATSEWKEAAGSPFTLKNMKQGPYVAVIQLFNYQPPGTCSAKLDYALITSPKTKGSAKTGKTSEKKKSR